MIDSDNLRTASLYINNQLLSRGLLRDGQNINFADPETDAGGLQATMGRVMSVVNDLILRRDRDTAQRESLSRALLTLRADAQRQTTDANRQADKLCDAQRKIDGAEATERALRTQLKTTESTIHKLRDEMAKMKTLVAQSRAACANEVRKRDRQIDGLKKALADAGRVRGGGKNSNVVTISVSGETGAEEKAEDFARGSTDDEGYSLRMETNEFLTELARGLSDENSTLLDLMRRTVDGLREMSGLEAALGEHGDANNMGADLRSAEELACELGGIMDHLRTILTNPSFVPIEEVEIREGEIHRLRDGFEKMTSRWKDAVRMIDGWRKRMASSGTSVNMEELQMGLDLSPVKVRNVAKPSDMMEPTEDDDIVMGHELSCVPEEDEEDEESDVEAPDSPSPGESLHLVPAPGTPSYKVQELEEEGGEDDDASDSSSIFQDEVDPEELDVEEPNIEVLQESTAASMDSPPLPIPPQLSPLKESSGNRQSADSERGSHRKRPGDFTTIVEENTWELAASNNEPPQPPPHKVIRLQSPQKSTKPTQELLEPPRPLSTTSFDSPLFGNSIESPIRANPSRKLFTKETVTETKPRSHPEPEAMRSSKLKSKSQPEPEPKSARQTRSIKKISSETNRTTSDPSRTERPSITKQAGKRTASAPNPTPPPREEVNTSSPSKSMTIDSRNRSPARSGTNSRLPRPNNPAPQQSPLSMASIAAKLAASEREADAARVRAKLKAARMGKQQSIVPDQASQPEEPVESVVDPVKKNSATIEQEKQLKASQNNVYDDWDELGEPRKPVGKAEEIRKLRPEKRKREKRPSKATSRRRSTLSPWELESLIQGNMNVKSPAH